MSVLIFVSRDIELGRTWLAGGVDRQSCTGLLWYSEIKQLRSHLGLTKTQIHHALNALCLIDVLQ